MSKGSIHADFLRRVKDSGGRVVGARFTLQRGALKDVEPMFHLRLEQRGIQSLQELPWSVELDSYLLFELKLKMDRSEEESERFSAILINNLETAREIYGDTFARTALIESLKASDVYRSIDLLQIANPPMVHFSKSLVDCQGFLDDSIEGLRASAVLELGYSDDEALTILTSALRIVLEEVFHLAAGLQLFRRG